MPVKKCWRKKNVFYRMRSWKEKHCDDLTATASKEKRRNLGFFLHFPCILHKQTSAERHHGRYDGKM